jgi:flavin reductase (DIM6/NTAB) family NADH-FMN oxidoreductase RutF
MKRRIIPSDIETKDLHQYIIGSIAPRPIAFVSTKDKSGNDNLAPYSFFNAFSSNPPILVFSSNRKVSDNTIKDTLQNVIETKEAVINVVNYDIVRQMSLASVEFPKGESEFTKVGLNAENAHFISAKLVKESPVNMECKVQEIITLGDKGGAGHLIICEVLCIHISENVLEGDRINPHKLDLMGRMGRSYYVRASGNAVSEIYQSVVNDVIGWNGLPKFLIHSDIFTANEIAMLASCREVPKAQKQSVNINKEEAIDQIKFLLKNGQKEEAFQLIMNVNGIGIL